MFKKIHLIKFLLLIGISLSFSTITFSQYAKNEKEIFGLVGAVKTVIREDAKIVSESGEYIEKDRKHFRTTTFDLEGNIIKEDPIPGKEAPPSNGSVIREQPEIKLFYNDSGKVTEERQVLKNGTVVSQRQFLYDSKGRTLEWRFSYLNTLTGKLELEGRWLYERDGNTTKSTLYDGCCIVKRWQIATVNERKDIIGIASYRADGTLIYKTSYAYEYGSTGNWLKRTLSSWVTNKEKSFFEPREVTYRTISYY